MWNTFLKKIDLKLESNFHSCNKQNDLISSVPSLTEWLAVALTSVTGAGQTEQQGQEGTHQDRMQGSHVFVLKV